MFCVSIWRYFCEQCNAPECYVGKIPETIRLRRGYRAWSDRCCAESTGGVMHGSDADSGCNYLLKLRTPRNPNFLIENPK